MYKHAVIAVMLDNTNWNTNNGSAPINNAKTFSIESEINDIGGTNHIVLPMNVFVSGVNGAFSHVQPYYSNGTDSSQDCPLTWKIVSNVVAYQYVRFLVLYK